MPAPEKNSLTRIEWLAAALITLAVLWLHLHFWQNAGGLWRDEINTVNLAQNPSFAALSHDTFPILMPLTVKIWSVFGRSDLSLRFLGMIFGLLLPLAFWLVARATQKPPLFSLVLFGMNPLLIGYGDSLRAYGLGSALLVLALAAMWAFLKSPTWSRAGMVALMATLSVQTLFQSALLFFAVGLGAFAVCARRKDFPAAQKIICAGTVAALSLLPYVPNFFALQTAAVELRRGFSLFITNLNFEMATGFPFLPFTAVWQMLAVLVIGLAALSLRQKRTDSGFRAAQTPSPSVASGDGTTDAPKASATNSSDSRIDLALFAGVTLAAVIALFVGFLWFAAAGARPWYFLPPLALAAVAFDFGLPLTALPRLARVSVLAVLLGLATVATLFATNELRGHFTNANQLAARVAAEAASQDFVIVTPWFCGITFDRYFSAETPWSTLPPLADHATHRYDLVLDAMKDTNSLVPVLEKISATLRAGQRVWVVGLMEFPDANSVGPLILPPPPLKDYGWSDTPYLGSWRDRTAYFLARHSQRFEILTGPNDGAPIFQENLRLFRAEGWRE